MHVATMIVPKTAWVHETNEWTRAAIRDTACLLHGRTLSLRSVILNRVGYKSKWVHKSDIMIPPNSSLPDWRDAVHRFDR